MAFRRTQHDRLARWGLTRSFARTVATMGVVAVAIAGTAWADIRMQPISANAR